MRTRWMFAVVLLGWFSMVCVAQECTVQAFFASVATGDNARAILLQTVNGARERLDIAVDTLTDDDLGDAIVRAHRRGLAVRVILAGGRESEPGGQYAKLRSAGVPVRLSGGSGTFGHRFTVVDERIVLTGSYAWADSTAAGRFESLVRMTCPIGSSVALAFAAEFDRLWAQWSDTEPVDRGEPSAISSVSILSVDRNAQCIDLFNSSDRAVDVSGWALSDQEGRYTFPAGTSLPPSDPFRICIDEYNPTHDIDALFLDPVHDELYLITPGGTILDEVVW